MICKNCHKEGQIFKPERAKKVKSGWITRNICNECIKQYKREKKIHFKYRYGITLEDYNHQVERQQGLCAICKKAEKLFVDHCHTTKKFRGLLCNSCNLALGFFKDNLESIKQAEIYLKISNE